MNNVWFPYSTAYIAVLPSEVSSGESHSALRLFYLKTALSAFDQMEGLAQDADS